MPDIAVGAGVGAVLIVTIVLLVFAVRRMFSTGPVERKYRGRGLGIGGAFDAVWMPSADEAGSERDRQHRRTAPAPVAGDPPDLAGAGAFVVTVDPEDGS